MQSIDDLFDDDDVVATMEPDVAHEDDGEQHAADAEREIEQEFADNGGKTIEEHIEDTEKERRANWTVRPHDVQRGVTHSQWLEIEDYYLHVVNQIEILEEPQATDLLRINAELDRVFTQARFDQAFTARRLKSLSRKMDNAKKTVYKQIKDVARNDKERDAEGIEWLENNPLPGFTMPIFDLVDEMTDRDEFMDSVISTLKTKADRLIIAAAALKIEMNLLKG